MTVQNHKYNFSIKREKRKLACFSEREKNRPKVNGKEFDGMHGLNTYDYGARQYNPITARWDRVDPLAEKYYPYSPYMYCLGNPMNAIDPDGNVVLNGNANTVTHTLATTTKYYISGTTLSASGNSAITFDTGIYATQVAGEFSAVRHSFNVSGTEKAYMQYNSTDNSIEFIFA